MQSTVFMFSLLLACNGWLLLNQVTAFSPSSFYRTRPLVNRCQPQLQVTSSRLYGIAEQMGSLLEVIVGQKTITEKNIEDTLKEVKNILIDADVNLQVANSLITKVKERALGMKVQPGQTPGQQFIALLGSELVELMGAAQAPLVRRTDSRPTIIMMLGLQGAGKTTAAGKLANYLLKKDQAKKILLVAADVYRPAAIEQLQTLGSRLNVDVYSEGVDAEPVQICRRAFNKAKTEGYDTIIIDTAGRQVVDARLMDELQQIKGAVLPDESLLVVDAMTGQEAATLTAKFNQDIGITGAILTKLDGDTRGGSALSVRGVSGKPIKFIGVGEGMDDLEPFFPDRMATRILGLGDVQTLLEKAQSAIDSDKALQLTRKMQKGDFDFDDFLLQIRSIKQMGGLGSMMKMMPGMAGKVTDEQFYQMEQRVKRVEQIVQAMTPEERANPDLLTVMVCRIIVTAHTPYISESLKQNSSKTTHFH